MIPACTIVAALAKEGGSAGETAGRETADAATWREALAGLLKALRARPGVSVSVVS